MTQHDAEILAQFVQSWVHLKRNPSLQACLTLDLDRYLREHAMEFDHVAYWNMVQKTRGVRS